MTTPCCRALKRIGTENRSKDHPRIGDLARVASDRQVDGGSGLTCSAGPSGAWCRVQRHRLVALMADEGVSGTLADRPALARGPGPAAGGEGPPWSGRASPRPPCSRTHAPRAAAGRVLEDGRRRRRRPARTPTSAMTRPTRHAGSSTSGAAAEPGVETSRRLRRPGGWRARRRGRVV